MYRLLLVSDRADIHEAYDKIDWVSIGFRPPRKVTSVRAAIETMEKHHVDSIAVGLDREEGERFVGWLLEHKPYLPMIQGWAQVDQVQKSAEMLAAFLNKIKADFSNDDISPKEMMTMLRHDFIRKLLGGEIAKPEDVRSQLILLRSRMDLYAPCIVVDLSLQEGDRFFTERWHYGNVRLERALRNFLGAEYENLRMVVAVLPDQRIRLLCCPMLNLPVETDSMTSVVTRHTEEAIRDIDQFLGLNLHITGVSVYRNVLSLAAEA